MGQILHIVLGIALGVLVISLLVLVHEAGHFVAMRYFKVPVEVFSIGFFKPLVRFERRGVRYQIGSIPLGGFVRPVSKGHQDKFGLYGKTSLIGTVVITLAGVFVNLVVAFLAFLTTALVDGYGLSSFVRAGKAWWYITELFTTSLPEGAKATFTHPGSGQGFSGPVGVTHTFATYGTSTHNVLVLAGLISLSIGLMNLLPLAILDGGQCLLGLIQHVRGRPLSERTTERLAAASFALVVTVLILSTYGDLVHL